MKLKYGMNPYQKFAEVEENGSFRLLNGNPSVINVLDALNSWQLVKEIRQYNGAIAAASFKHVTPSGVAIARPLSTTERASYFIDDELDLSPLASAYVLARGSDRLASFGDFIAVNGKIDYSVARVIRSEVSDGIIAPAYDPKALALLKKKKGGNYVIFEIDAEYEPKESESREVFGIRITQDRNNARVDKDLLRSSVVTETKEMEDGVMDDLCIGMITLKYTQSNSICVIREGHVIGIGSGQQSRILCTELALSKAKRWFQKRNLDYGSIEFPADSTRTEKDQIVEDVRKRKYDSGLEAPRLEGLAMCSDGFFTQTDNTQLAEEEGVKYIAAPMGSIRDTQIIEYCSTNNIVFCDTRLRLFQH